MAPTAERKDTLEGETLRGEAETEESGKTLRSELTILGELIGLSDETGLDRDGAGLLDDDRATDGAALLELDKGTAADGEETFRLGELGVTLGELGGELGVLGAALNDRLDTLAELTALGEADNPTERLEGAGMLLGDETPGELTERMLDTDEIGEDGATPGNDDDDTEDTGAATGTDELLGPDGDITRGEDRLLGDKDGCAATEDDKEDARPLGTNDEDGEIELLETATAGTEDELLGERPREGDDEEDTSGIQVAKVVPLPQPENATTIC